MRLSSAEAITQRQQLSISLRREKPNRRLNACYYLLLPRKYLFSSLRQLKLVFKFQKTAIKINAPVVQ